MAFESDSTDLLADGTNGNVSVFVRDLQTGITTIVSVDSGGTEGNGDSSCPLHFFFGWQIRGLRV